jgi:hypothetical protein
LRGHVTAFTTWGEPIGFHPIQLVFAGHYRYEPRPVVIAQ